MGRTLAVGIQLKITSHTRRGFRQQKCSACVWTSMEVYRVQNQFSLLWCSGIGKTQDLSRNEYLRSWYLTVTHKSRPCMRSAAVRNPINTGWHWGYIGNPTLNKPYITPHSPSESFCTMRFAIFTLFAVMAIAVSAAPAPAGMCACSHSTSELLPNQVSLFL
jgi:hypothetical protein